MNHPSSSALPNQKSYLTDGVTLRSWFLTTDHKRIAVLYLIAILVAFTVAALAMAAIRIELLTPNGDFVQAETYNRLFTLHGILMVFFFLVPVIPAVLGNFLVPIMIGTNDMAFPRLNLLSWYVYLLGFVVTMTSVLLGGVDTGWTFYTPFSTLYSNSHVMLAALGVFIAGFSSILTALNIIVTVHRMRAPGLTWFRLPLFIWTMYATSLIIVLGTPVLTMVMALVGIERTLGVGIFDPAIGGDPLLFQHLFWFYSHPAVYIMVLPAMGVVSEILPCFARRPIFGYRMIAYSSIGIAFLGFLVWGHHMFVSGQSVFASLAFSFLSFAVAIPSAIKVINWTATLYRGSIELKTPMLYALGFIALFTIGGLTGLMLAALSVDVHVHDTYFVIAHFHFIMVGGSVMALLGGIHFWWPKITGKLYPEKLSAIAAVALFVGFVVTFMPQFVLGYQGMPRRYHSYPEQYQALNVISSFGAVILAVAYTLPFVYLSWSFFFGAKASANPWQAKGLEWQTSSPPPTHNFTAPLIIDDMPYDYTPQNPTDTEGSDEDES